MHNEKRVRWRIWFKIEDSKKKRGLGFRDLGSFNKVMLAKQCWRILNHLFSMVAKILKEKYFKHGRLLEAKLGYGSSLI